MLTQRRRRVMGSAYSPSMRNWDAPLFRVGSKGGAPRLPLEVLLKVRVSM